MLLPKLSPALSLVAGFLLASSLHAASNVTISAAATSGGSFSGTNPKVFTPTAANAVANRTTVETSLNAGTGVSILTASGAGSVGDLTVAATVTKSAGTAATLSLNAVRDLLVNDAIGSTNDVLNLSLTAGRTVALGASVSLNGGTLTVNSGAFTPGDGAQFIAMTGDLTILAAARTAVKLDTNHGRFAVNGNVVLDGALDLSFTNSFEDVISAGNMFPIITATGVTGTFAGLPDGSRVTLPNDLGSIKINYTATAVTLSDWQPVITDLTWDPGTDDDGTQVFANGNTRAGRHYFRIVTEDPDIRAWRTRLTVLSGEAHLYMSLGALPITTSAQYTSERVGHDGWVRRSDQFSAGQEWFILVYATTAGSQWSLLSGRPYVQPLGLSAPFGTLKWTDTNTNGIYDIGETALASGSGVQTFKGEGMRFFRQTVPVGTPAWSLWLNGQTRDLAIRRDYVPFPNAQYDRQQAGQMLVVPPYLDASTDTYFLSVVGNPGETVNLDSRIQEVSVVSFGTTQASVDVPAAPYRVYRVQVPVQQIAWDVSTTRVLGDPNVCVRRDNVPAEFDNDAFSEVPGTVKDSITLVPNFLTDGTWFITVYGTGAYRFTLQNGTPTISPILFDKPDPLIETKTNDEQTRAGWRFYALTDIQSQLGSLGWELNLLPGTYVPGTEIAIRRNAVPSRWRFRTGGSTNIGTTGALDFSGPDGFLQRPGHQADIWYIGIYMPTQALGTFQLTSEKMDPPIRTFDGGGIQTITGQEPGRWKYVRVDVPSGVDGWDVRLRDVTGGQPVMTVRRDQLAESSGTGPWIFPQAAPNWPSGYQWGGSVDWSGYPGVPHRLVTGMGRPLEPGTYYVGVFNSGVGNAGYTIDSRGIGASQTYTIGNLNFSGGGSSVAVTNLVPREARYFRINIPASQPSWEVTLTPTVGEALLLARRGTVPDFQAGLDGEAGPLPESAFDLEVEMQKLGPERYVMLPPDGEDFLVAGDYIVAVVSEGVGPVGQDIGTGTINATLTSLGTLAVTNRGNVTTAGSSTAVNLASAQVKAYEFNVPAGTRALEARLENRVGNPWMILLPGTDLPNPYMGLSYYGIDGGANSGVRYDNDIITFAEPPSGPYRLIVRALPDETGYPAASATLVLRAITAAPVVFNGGALPVTAQAPDSWRFFSVTVPANATGWDVRLRDVTGSGTAVMSVRRDLFPLSDGTGPWIQPEHHDTWPSGYQWGGGVDWTGYANNPSLTPVPPRLVAGMGRPLQQGDYIVAVHNTSTTDAVSYTIDSRGIGAGMFYLTPTLAYSGAGSSVTITNLVPREPRYYKVTILAGTPSWEVTLATTTGDAELLVRRGTVPDFAALDYGDAGVLPADGGSWEVEMQKFGPERYVMLPPNGEDFLTPGDYFLAVVSEGVDPAGSVIGTGTSSAVLTSLGALAVTNLNSAGGAGISTPVSLAGGQMKAFEFTVPAGTASLEVRLDNRVENPWFVFRPGTRLPFALYAGNSYYGTDGGTLTDALADDNIVTLADPPTGTYRLIVRAAQDLTGAFPPASATLVIRALGPQPLDFDGGVAGAISITDQSPNSWRYFDVIVPTNAAGWDVRLRDKSGAGLPRMVVRRGQLPNSVGTQPWSFPATSTSWPPGYQWAGQIDWTNYSYDDGAPTFPTAQDRLVMGISRPLEAGAYTVGVYNNSATDSVSYTIDSRGIGNGFTYPITTVAFTGGTAPVVDLEPREARYFKIAVPANRASWEVRLDPSVGEALLLVRRGSVPDFYAYDSGDAGVLPVDGREVEVKMQKAGPERYVMLPPDGTDLLLDGDYYLAVVSEGVNPNPPGSIIGTGQISADLTSVGPIPLTNLGFASLAGSNTSVTLDGGQLRLYEFTVPAGTQSLEVRLDNRVGNPWLAFQPGTRPPHPYYAGSSYYGHDGGTLLAGLVSDDNLITVANPAAGPYRLIVRAAQDNTGMFPDASASLIVRQKPNLPLNFDISQNGNGLSHTDTRQIIDGEYIIYQIAVPTMLGAQPVLGWVLDTDVFQGAVSLQVYRDFANPNGGVNIVAATAVVVPPFLTPGDTWYVRVRATGFTNYTLTSRPVTLNRPVWSMPIAHNVTFGDSGLDSGGVPLPGDQGVDLGEGKWHFYSIDVPVGNRGLLRTELDAISGNPDLYIREDGVPTTDHNSAGPFGAALYYRQLTGLTTEYGNWVPLNGRTERELAPGRWYLGVKANGGSNVRYRLRASTGNVQELSLNNATLPGQVLADNDWRYYRFTVPLDAPSTWSLNFSQQVGDVVMWLRDTVPPGDTYANNSATASWTSDQKNQGPYPSVDPAGTHPFTTPPLRPNHTYYIGFRSNNSASFSIGSATTGTIGLLTVIPFYMGTESAIIPPNGSRLYRIAVPADGARFKYTSTHDAAVQIRVEQGTLPAVSSTQHYASFGADSALNIVLGAANWPWVPDQSYFVRFVNTTGVAQPIVFRMDGRNALNEDEDADGLSDFWERQKFSGLHRDGSMDLEGDGANNFLEFASNLNPNAPDARTLVPGSGTAGLPSIRLVGTGNACRLQVEFLRRRNFFLTYRVEFADTLGTWTPATSTPIVTPIDAEFERVIMEDTMNIGTHPRRFGRVFISSP